jgi:hypothetical protein
MSNIIQDYNNKNNPETVDKLELPDTAAPTPQPTSKAPEDNYVQATQSYVQYGDTPQQPPEQDFTGFIPPTVEPNREQSVVDLGAFQGLPTGQEIDQAVKQGFQDRLDWVRAQQANYTQAPVFDVTGNGYDYSLDTPQIDPFVPSNLNWKENAQTQYQTQVAQEQARLNEVGYNIEPQTNVVAQQGGFNAPVGTSSGGWSIGGLWQDIQGAFGFGQRAVTTTLESAIGRKVQNPLDVVEGLARTSLNPAGYVTTAAELALNEKKRNEAVKAAQRNFNPQTFNKNEVGVVKGLAPVKGPVNLSQGRFGDYGTGAPGAINYTLDNFLGGNTVRGLIANGKRNIENAANGRPQQWDEGLGVVAALKGRDYSFLNDKNKDTGVLGTNIHGGGFWARAGGGFIADAVTDLSPLGVVKQAIKKGAKAGLKSVINSAVSPTTLKQLADNGDVIVEVSKKSVNGVKGTDLTTKKLAEILSPEKRAYYEKQGLVVVGAKQVEGPSAKKLAQQATRDAKKTAKTGKPVRRATPEVEYEFITRKKSELVQEGVSILTPKVAGQAPLNEVVSKPTLRSRFVEGRINDILPSPGATRDNPARIGEVGTPIPRPENPIQLKRREAGVQRAEQAAQQNPFLRNLIHKDKPPTELAGNGEVLGRVVTKAEVSPVTQYVKAVTDAPETVLTDTVTRQLREPGAVENVLRQAELDGTIEVKPSGVIVSKVDSGIEAAQKELIRLRIEQTNLKRNTPNFDLVGQPGTKLGNQVQDIQQKIDELRQTISGGRVRREDYDVITNQDLDTLIPVIPSRTTDPLPLTPSTLYTRLKNESGVLQRGEFVERSMDDLSALAEFLGHRKPGLQKSITADQLEDLRTEYGMVYSRVGEPIDRGAIEQYLKTGVGRVETKPATASSPQVETMVIRRNDKEFGVVEGGGKTTTERGSLTVIKGGYQKPVDEMSLEELFAEVDNIGSKYDDVALPDVERFAANRIASDLAKEALDPLRSKVAAGLENEFGVRTADVTPLRPTAGDNVLEMTRGASGKKYKYKSTGTPAPERGVLRKLELVQTLREELVNKIDDGVTDQAELLQDIDALSLTKQKLEELDPVEARKTERYFDSLPETPTSVEAEDAARLVRESEQLVADTAQRVRDLNLNIESLRQQLDVDNQRLLELPAVEPQPLDIGSYDLGLTSERIIGQSTVKPVPRRQSTSGGALIRKEDVKLDEASQANYEQAVADIKQQANEALKAMKPIEREIADTERAISKLTPDELSETNLELDLENLRESLANIRVPADRLEARLKETYDWYIDNEYDWLVANQPQGGLGTSTYTSADIDNIVNDWTRVRNWDEGAPGKFRGGAASGEVDRFNQVWQAYIRPGQDEFSGVAGALRETDNFGSVEQGWLGMLRFAVDRVVVGKKAVDGVSLLSSPLYELAWSMVRTLQREAPEQFEELFAKLGKKMYPYKDVRAERELSSTEWLQRAEEYIKQNNVTNTINEEKFWHGSSFPDALEYGPEGVRPTRNTLGLGHYLYRDGSDAEAAARSVLPDNHVDVGLTPSENGVVQQVNVSVSTPLDATLPGSDDARYAFRQAIRDTFGDEGVALAKRWDTKTEGKPLSTYWDEATLAWSKLNKGEQIPEDVFRQLEVNISNNLIDLGYDSINHPRVLVLLDGSMAQGLDDVLELAPSNYSEKLLAQVNTTKLWQAVSPGDVADVHALNAQIEVGEALVDDSMQMLAKASADNQAAVEQMLRASDELSARLDADRVSRELKLQREGSDTVSRETDSLLKRDNDEHPGCL